MAGFVENEDFEVVEILSSPILGSSKARPQKTKNYLLSMDMAKELSMLERNDRGKQARWPSKSSRSRSRWSFWPTSFRPTSAVV